MGVGVGAKKTHKLYKVNRRGSKSGYKNKKAIEWYIDLLKKQNKYGLTKWVQKTKQKAEERLKKYGIKYDMINEVLDTKGLTDLKI